MREKLIIKLLVNIVNQKGLQFSKKTVSTIEVIAINNQIGSRHKKTFYRKFLISNQVYLFYKVEIQTLYIVLFWDNKRNPADLEIILSS